jgi:adenylate cyclase
MQYKVLFVDDETANLRLLERLFRNTYEVLTASSADEALDLLAVHDVALIVSDQRMPAMPGSEFLKRAAEMRPQTVRIMLTGYTDANDLVDAINSGVIYKYVTKPWVNEELKQTVKRALQHYESMKAQRQLQTQSERLQTRLKATKEGFVGVILTMMDDGFPYFHAHAQRTSALAAAIGDRFDLDWEDREELILAARLEEAALFRVPKDIRFKHDDPTAEEVELMISCLEYGSKVLGSVPDLVEVAGALRFQFERYDGSGRPSGFAGVQIPLTARIIAVASAYDKLRHPWTGSTADHDEAVRQLMLQAGSKFDPEIIDTLRQVCSMTGELQESELLTLG